MYPLNFNNKNDNDNTSDNTNTFVINFLGTLFQNSEQNKTILTLKSLQNNEI